MEEDLKGELPKGFLEWIVFKTYDISSKHSQNWLLSPDLGHKSHTNASRLSLLNIPASAT